MDSINTEKLAEALSIWSESFHYNSEPDPDNYWRKSINYIHQLAGLPRIHGTWDRSHPEKLITVANLIAQAVDFEKSSKGPEYWDTLIMRIRILSRREIAA